MGVTKIFNLTKDQVQKAHDIHRKAIVIDGAVMYESLEYPKDLERMRVGGISAASFTIAHWPHNFLRTLRRIDRFKELIDENTDLLLTTSVEEIRQAKKAGQIGVIFAFQDGKPIEDKLGNMRIFHDLGVRIIQLTYNSQNLIGTGCCERTYNKLSYFGLEVVKEMNKRGMVIDLSHCSDETTMDALETSKDPCLFTHSNPRSLCNAYGRNKTDEQIKALAENGGVMGVCWQPFLMKREPQTHKVLECTIEDVLDHMDYITNLVGVDHVGFGSDLLGRSLDRGKTPWYSSFRLWRPLRPDVFGSGPTEVYDPFPTGLTRHSDTPNITMGLVSRGYSEQEILKILGRNFLRVFEEVWKK